tara:strand:- start:77 stop:235 length:159 start_codon:yes stop_codon:yes gene_type:complete
MEIIKQIFQVFFFLIAIYIFVPMLSPRFWREFIANQRLRKAQKEFLYFSEEE